MRSCAGPVISAEYTYSIILAPSADGFVVSFPSFPGLVAQGESLETVRARAHELLVRHLEQLRADGKSPPASEPFPMPIREPLSVRLPAA
jgi:predicted RNase H-like HicB family nuclease